MTEIIDFATRARKTVKTKSKPKITDDTLIMLCPHCSSESFWITTNYDLICSYCYECFYQYHIVLELEEKDSGSDDYS